MDLQSSSLGLFLFIQSQLQYKLNHSGVSAEFLLQVELTLFMEES